MSVPAIASLSQFVSIREDMSCLTWYDSRKSMNISYILLLQAIEKRKKLD